MKESLIHFFSLIGISVSIVFIAGIIFVIYQCAIKKIEELKYYYKVKHRFDKPPLAKCYCKDCKYYDNGKCYSFTKRHTADNWFCSWAERKQVENE